jgi:hypothetical protein
MQRRTSAGQGRLRRIFPLQPLDLRCEVAPLHGEIEERAAHVPVSRFLRDPVAFQGIGSAVFFGH